MKKNFKQLIFASMVAIAPFKAYSQETEMQPRWFGAVTYDMAIPFGDSKDFGGGFSPRGIGIDARYFFNPNWSAGFSGGWELFTNGTTQPVTLQNGNITIQGTQSRYLNMIPILFGGHYYVRHWLPSWCIPYGGLSLGTYWAERSVDIGIYSITDSSWHFALAPELGLAFRVNHVLPLLRFRYNYLFGSGGSGDLPFLTISVGLAWN